MGKTLEEMLNELSKERQGKIEAMAAELIAEEMSLRKLRQDLNLTRSTLLKSLESTKRTYRDNSRRTAISYPNHPETQRLARRR
jgi:hypothetical protein